MRYKVMVSDSYKDGRLFNTLQSDLMIRQAVEKAASEFSRKVEELKAAGSPVETQEDSPYSWQIQGVREVDTHRVPYTITYLVCKDN